MVPAVKAAMAAGVVDPKKIRITGHSWGGYQTAFLITRMKEYFDRYLMGAPAPDWMTNGVPRLQMDEHLEQRKAAPKPKRITTAPDAGR